MQTYLYLHKENTGIPQAQFRGRYPLRHMDYELGRAVGRRGGDCIRDPWGRNPGGD